MNKLGLYLLAVFSFPNFSQIANADVAGRYENTDENAIIDFEMTVEADEPGNVRIQMASSGGYYLFRDGTLYLVTMGNEDTTVMRVADTLAIQREVLARSGWKEPSPPPSVSKAHFAPMEEVTVAGRQGTAFGIVSEKHKKPVYGSIVMSDDPELAGLGKALARVNASSIEGLGSMGSMLQMMNAEMVELLKQGAPLRMLSVELTDVSFDIIPSERFALPAEPLTIDEIRALIVKPTVPPPPTLPPRGE